MPHPVPRLMAGGSHRGPRRSPGPGGVGAARTVAAVAAVVGLVAAVVAVSVVVLVRVSEQPPSDRTAGAAASTTSGPSDAPGTPDASGTADPTPRPRTAARGQERTSGPAAPTAAAPLPEASPRRLTLLADGTELVGTDFDSAVPQTSAPLVPLSTAEVTRLADRGLPGSPGSDTVVVVGDASADGVWSALPQLVPGDRAVLRTEAGELVYEVAGVRGAAPEAVLDDAWLTEADPGSLVLVGRYAESDADLLVRARLVSASPA